MLCKGSWKETAQNIVYNENIVECELRSINGNWIYNKLKFFPEYEYHNINGRFQWIFDNSILFLIMNMKKIQKDGASWKKILKILIKNIIVNI